MISHTYKCIFVHIPKTAGTSISKKLGSFEELKRGVQDHRTIKEVEPLNLIDWSQIVLKRRFVTDGKLLFDRVIRNQYIRRMDIPTQDQYHNYFKFTFVRNPWARVFSWYNNVLRDPIKRNRLGVLEDCSFPNFVKNHMDTWGLRPQTWWIKDWKNEIPLDFIGRFENLNEDFHHVCDVLGIENCELPHLIAGNTASYIESYNQELSQIVADLYAEEIKLFGYTFP